jgi:hypothetical protein
MGGCVTAAQCHVREERALPTRWELTHANASRRARQPRGFNLAEGLPKQA